MKVSKRQIERIIKEELAAHIQELQAEDEKDKKKPATQDAEDAASEKPAPSKTPAAKPTPNADPTMDKTDKAPGSPPIDGDEEVPDAEDPSDEELDDPDADGDEGDDDRTGGKLAEKITGKRIQSISFEPKSKTVPGASEIVLTFDETPDSFRILVTKTGQIKYFMNGLHDEL